MRWQIMKISAAYACLLLAFAGALALSHNGARLAVPAALKRLVQI